jgi:creatinine amidohydrolase
MKANVFMAELTSRDFARRVVDEGQAVLLPVGAVEQHGWHLPLGVDWMMAQEVSRRVAERVDAVVAPPVCYGYKSQIRSGGGEHLIGTTGVRANTLVQFVLDVLVSLGRKGARRLVVLDGHYENGMMLAEACDLAIGELAAGGIDNVQILKLLYAEDLPDALLKKVYEDCSFPGLALEHAALLETAMMLHCFPQLVGDFSQIPQTIARFPPYDVFPPIVDWVPKSGGLAGAAGATAEKGRWLVDHFVDSVSNAIQKELYHHPVIAKGST